MYSVASKWSFITKARIARQSPSIFRFALKLIVRLISPPRFLVSHFIAPNERDEKGQGLASIVGAHGGNSSHSVIISISLFLLFRPCLSDISLALKWQKSSRAKYGERGWSVIGTGVYSSWFIRENIFPIVEGLTYSFRISLSLSLSPFFLLSFFHVGTFRCSHTLLLAYGDRIIFLFWVDITVTRCNRPSDESSSVLRCAGLLWKCRKACDSLIFSSVPNK